MATPQCEDGYTRIANELLEALCRVPLGNSEAQVFFCIMRKTYGWSKKQDNISIDQISEATGVSRRMVIYCLQNLESKKMVTVQRRRGKGLKSKVNTVSIQKNHSIWVVQGKSEQYKKTLEMQRVRYSKSSGSVVQGKISSARKGDLVVQGEKKKGQFLAPTKETRSTKERTKEMKEKIPKEMLEICRAWKAYIQMRKTIKHPLTDYAMELAAGKLEKFSLQGQDPIAVLNQSIEASWQGLFAVKAEQQPRQQGKTFKQIDREEQERRASTIREKNHQAAREFAGYDVDSSTGGDEE
jgi:phage replication O-like protein O